MDSDKRENLVLERLGDDRSVCVRRRLLKHHINFKCIYNALLEWKIYFLKVLSYNKITFFAASVDRRSIYNN